MDCTALAEHLWLIITIQFQIKSMIAFLRSVVKQDKIRHGGSEAVQHGITRYKIVHFWFGTLRY